MTKTQQEEHLRDKMLLYSRYQKQLRDRNEVIQDEIESLRTNLIGAIDHVLGTIELGLKQNELT